MPNVIVERLLNEAEGHRRTYNYAAAARLVDQALALDPEDIRALASSAGIIAAEGGQKDTALSRIKKALKRSPNSPVVISNAAFVFMRYGQLHRARQLWEQLNELQPGSVNTLWNLATYHLSQDEVEVAAKYLRKVMELEPRRAELYMNLGHALKRSGRIDEAIAIYREGARLFPQDIRQSSNFLYALHYDPAYGPEQIHAEQVAWGQALESAIPAATSHAKDRSPDRRLRIGYVSPDFRDHVAGHLFLPFFRHHDHSRFEIFCYSDARRTDDMTGLIRQSADTWRDTASLSDAELAVQVSQDQIDILVDLVMHMEGTRLGMFARKPAPLQITWLAYPGSTGLSRMDYRFTDPILDPPGETDHFYTEQSIRLESFWCFGPPTDSPAVGPLPAEKNGYVTFGCLNNFTKVNDTVMEAWRQILAAVPNSRLVLMPPNGKITNHIQDKLGVARNRLIGLPRESRSKFLKYHHRIDLALDPFPYTGHTTTLDALWMGVPVVTLVGQTVASRGSLSILSNLGLSELAVTNKNDYVALVVALAQDQARLRDLRAGLRERLERSVLMDAERFVRTVESAYRAMSHKWCESPA